VRGMVEILRAHVGCRLTELTMVNLRKTDGARAKGSGRLRYADVRRSGAAHNKGLAANGRKSFGAKVPKTGLEPAPPCED
jgi:hypothetical protein